MEELFLRSDFIKLKPRSPSKILPGHFCAAEEEFSCPKCGSEALPPQHGVLGHCSCGLHWISFGNQLSMWIDPDGCDN
jgi:hypothetical protein